METGFNQVLGKCDNQTQETLSVSVFSVPSEIKSTGIGHYGVSSKMYGDWVQSSDIFADKTKVSEKSINTTIE